MQDTKLQLLVNRLKRQLLSRVWMARIVILSGLAMALFIVIKLVSPYTGAFSSLFTPLTSQLTHSSGRTNIIFLGIGGPGHEAPDLTDTIILASIKLDTGQVSLLSIPRDIWVPSMRAKVNTAYHYGNLRRPADGGLILAKSSVSEVTGQPVHYAAVLDFTAFVSAVDRLGGIDVEVLESFTDDRYPLPGREEDDCGGQDPECLCRYEAITFTKGPTHMDGQLALKHARSRHSTADSEGTDYARSRRQVQVIKAIQTKVVFMAKYPRNWSTLKAVYDSLSSSLVTDFPKDQTITLTRLGLMARKHDLATAALSDPDTLYHPPVSPLYDNQWVLIPRDNNPQIVFDFVAGLFK